MREIKLRIWLDYSNPEKFIYLDLRKLDDREKLADLTLNKLALFQQYTGLKDKNGKEIYEGDIIEYSSKWSFAIKAKDIVIFEQCMFGIKLMGHYDEQIKLTSLIIEVIGNIYENPELLEDK